MSLISFLKTLAVLTALVLLTFFGLQYLHLSTGALLDWLVGVVIFWWLLAITVLPWNVHFAAQDVVDEARLSQQHGLTVPVESLQYARSIAQRFRWLALALHLGSALILFMLAYYHWVSFGYVAAGAALALTIVRPLQRAYSYLSARLQALNHQVHYPREDVLELRTRVQALEDSLDQVSQRINPEEEGSWAHEQLHTQALLRQQVDRLDARLEELTRQNNREHEALARQTAAGIAQLSEDAQFLNQVRDLIRFVKNA